MMEQMDDVFKAQEAKSDENYQGFMKKQWDAILENVEVRRKRTKRARLLASIFYWFTVLMMTMGCAAILMGMYIGLAFLWGKMP